MRRTCTVKTSAGADVCRDQVSKAWTRTGV